MVFTLGMQLLQVKSEQMKQNISYKVSTKQEFNNRLKTETVYFETISTPFGEATIVETRQGICSFSLDSLPKNTIKDLYKPAKITNKLHANGKKIKQYFENNLAYSSKIQFELVGTKFQVQVWDALLKIPFAKTATYKDIAEAISKPKSFRAVGTALGKIASPTLSHVIA